MNYQQTKFMEAAVILDPKIVDLDKVDFIVIRSSLLLLNVVKALELDSIKKDDIDYLDAIFLTVFCDHFSRINGVSFEFAMSMAFYSYFSEPDYPHHLNRAIESHTEMAQEHLSSANVIGGLCAKWMIDPTDHNIDKLRKLYMLCLEHVT